ncbi:MAG: glycosyltransferase [Bacteroidetes bacterium]|nr:glycosyltransferase [Bacteroidota bacterium]MBS1929958.1 glycosyltransferase [Bacteroidota bacterium]
MVLLLIVILIFAGYSTLMFYYWHNWGGIPYFAPIHAERKTKISLIIPARNEEVAIPKLLQKLEQQTYPKDLFEIIVIDDHSTDKTYEIVQGFQDVKLIQLKDDNINSYKKKAIETGIAASKNEWIVCTDADCLPPAEWLDTIVSFKEKNNSVFIAAPVMYSNNNSLLQIFQSIDFLVLQGITAVSVFKNSLTVCNGANLSYDRKAFDEVNGFSGIDSIASGDDMLLMYKIWKKNPGAVHYLKSKSAMVVTEPAKTWKSFFNQRNRWASKATDYDDKRLLPVLLLVYSFNLSFFVLIIAGFWNYYYWLYCAGLWILKTLVEIPFVSSVAAFFGKQSLVKYFFFLQPLHIFYTIISGFCGQFGKYEWKGRKVK